MFFYATRTFYSKPFFTRLDIDESLFGTLVWKFVFYYNHGKNPFHNFRHGVNVLHSANYFLGCIDSLRSLILGFNARASGAENKKYLRVRITRRPSRSSDTKTLAFLLAALCHDLGHTSKTNSFEISTQSKLAIRYSDDSPLERHHTALLFKLCLETTRNNRKELKRTGLMETSKKENIFSGLTRKEYQRIRKGIIRMILSTDMKYHFEITQKFKSEAENFNFDKENRMTSSKGERSINCAEILEVAWLNSRISTLRKFC